MNQQERKYAVIRIKEITEQLFQKAKEKYIIPAKAPSPHEKLRLLQTGKVKFLSHAELVKKCRIGTRNVYSYRGPSTEVDCLDTPCSTNLDFSKYESKEIITGKYETAMNKIRHEAKRLEDELMLGDAKKALKTLAMFANMKI